MSSSESNRTNYLSIVANIVAAEVSRRTTRITNEEEMCAMWVRALIEYFKQGGVSEETLETLAKTDKRLIVARYANQPFFSFDAFKERITDIYEGVS